MAIELELDAVELTCSDAWFLNMWICVCHPSSSFPSHPYQLNASFLGMLDLLDYKLAIYRSLNPEARLGPSTKYLQS
jgi:hypothetical protein